MEEVKLNDIDTKGNSDFLILEEGSNKVRIVSGFVQRVQEFPTGPATKFCAWVIERKSGEVKLASFGKSIIKQLQGLSQNEEYAFESTPEYDIDIQRTGQLLETEYSLVPARQNTPITPEEKALVEARGSVADFIAKIEKKDVPQAPVDDAPVPDFLQE